MAVFYYNTLSLFGADQDLETAVLFFRQAQTAYQERNLSKLPRIGGESFERLMYNVEVHPIGLYPKVTYQTKWVPNIADIHFMSEELGLVIALDYYTVHYYICHKYIFTPGKFEQFAQLDEADRESIIFELQIKKYICQNQIFDTAELAIDHILYQKIRKEILESP